MIYIFWGWLCHVLTPASLILSKNLSKNTGRYKVQTLVQHDIRQAYKLELVSYNIRCPHYKMRFQHVAFSSEKAVNRKNSLQKFNQHGIQKNLLKHPPIFGYQNSTLRGNFLYKMLWLRHTKFIREIGRGLCFIHFDFEICFAPQRRAIFHLSSGQLAPHPPL